jgi:hypothetical protein
MGPSGKESVGRIGLMVELQVVALPYDQCKGNILSTYRERILESRLGRKFVDLQTPLDLRMNCSG